MNYMFVNLNDNIASQESWSLFLNCWKYKNCENK